MTTVHVSIGNTDGKLSHTEWAEFYTLTDELMTHTVSTATYGRWHSLPATPYVNACWAVEIPADLLPDFKVVLGELARRFRQDSIALLAGETEFVAGTSPAAGGETETGDGAVLTRAREAMREANIVASLARSRYVVTETPAGWDVRALDSEAGGWGAPSPTATKPDTAAGDGVALISAERARQISAEGWTPEHDAAHDDDALARAAACYAMPAGSRQVYNSARSGDGFLAPFPLGWPWDPSWWKPTPGDRVRELVKAGALIAAEIDRLRGTSPAAPEPGTAAGDDWQRRALFKDAQLCRIRDLIYDKRTVKTDAIREVLADTIPTSPAAPTGARDGQEARDLQAARTALPPRRPTICTCTHAYNRHGGNATERCWAGDCTCRAFTPASPPAAPADRLRAISLMWAQSTNRGRPFLTDTGNVAALRDLLDGYAHPDELPDPADVDVDIEHIRLANGPCVISVNGQGHLPCSEHPTAPVPDLMEALRLSIVEAKERREAKATDPGAVVCSACRRAHPEARECPPTSPIHTLPAGGQDDRSGT